MPKKLKVSIGSHRDCMEVAHVNDSSRPTVIDSHLFVGRVLVKIRDFEGVAPEGGEPIRDHPYFEGRSRKFDIQIEGRFKRREGVDPYSGEEVHFGSDPDRLVDFPKTSFNAGMRVARWIDPNTFYDLDPPSGRPYIMSPYLACMNTLCAWPAPHRMVDALVYLRSSERDELADESDPEEDLIPMEEVDGPAEAIVGKKKVGRTARRYWRFLGLRGDEGRIDAFLEKHRDYLAERAEEGDDRPPSPSSYASTRAPGSYMTAPGSAMKIKIRTRSGTVVSYGRSSRPLPRHQISFGAGMRDRFEDAEAEAASRAQQEEAAREMADLAEGDDESGRVPTEAASTLASTITNLSTAGSDEPTPPAELTPLAAGGHKRKLSGKFGLGKLKNALQKITPKVGKLKGRGPTPSPPSRSPTPSDGGAGSPTMPKTPALSPEPPTREQSPKSPQAVPETGAPALAEDGGNTKKPEAQGPPSPNGSAAEKVRGGADAGTGAGEGAEELSVAAAAKTTVAEEGPSKLQRMSGPPDGTSQGTDPTTTDAVRSEPPDDAPPVQAVTERERATPALAVPTGAPVEPHPCPPPAPYPPPPKPEPKPKARLDPASVPDLKDVEYGDLMFADQLSLPKLSREDAVDQALGPWRFGNPMTDILEDNTFVFLDRSVDVARRRKHFTEGSGERRRAFAYDPDVVYAASFFSPFMDFNTFDLAIGPVRTNVARFVDGMPIRYTLRSTRVVEESGEEEVFVTIAFELVDG